MGSAIRLVDRGGSAASVAASLYAATHYAAADDWRRWTILATTAYRIAWAIYAAVPARRASAAAGAARADTDRGVPRASEPLASR